MKIVHQQTTTGVASLWYDASVS